jgi:hypothetical protein
MTTKNNWITSNIRERLTDPNCDFKLVVNYQNPLYCDFTRAVSETAREISSLKKQVYIGYSGGLDSEFVVKTFLDLNLPFTPIIVKTTGNISEVMYAEKFCKANKLDPIVIECSEREMLKHFLQDIFNLINGRGQNSTSNVIAGRYVEKNSGIFLMGEHLIDDKSIGANEWDFYNDAIFDIGHTLHFFNYTPEICYSMIASLDFSISIQEAKSKLYGLEYRPKFNYEGYSEKYFGISRKIYRTRKFKPKSNYTLGLPETFLNNFGYK